MAGLSLPPYVAAEQIAVCHLDTNTPLGLFLAKDMATTFLVVDAEEGRCAIVLDGSGPHDFDVWKLEADMRSWSGLALGAVEVELDPSSATWHEGGLGSIVIKGGAASLIVKQGHRWNTFGIVLSTTAGNEADSSRTLSFARWRLVRRDHLGAAIEYFSHSPAQG